MKIEIMKQDEDKDEPVMKLFLAETNPGEIELKAKDKNDDDWVIATISTKGILIETSINKSSGWPLDRLGRLVTLKD